MQMPRWPKLRISRMCSELFTVLGDAWHVVLTGPPESTRPMHADTVRDLRRPARRAPPPRWSPMLGPTVQELSVVIGDVSGRHAGIANLRLVEQALHRPNGSLDQVSDAVLQQALAELRRIARHSKPTPLLACAIDHLRRQVLDRQIDACLGDLRSTPPPPTGRRPS